jgi:hypothetical protein
MVRLRAGSIGFDVVLDMCHVWRCVFCFGDVRWVRAVGLIPHVHGGLVEVNSSSGYQVHSPTLVAVGLLPFSTSICLRFSSDKKSRSSL